MDKRGQFYILLAIIIGIVIFSINTKQNNIKESTLFEDFYEVSQNYIEESPKVVNYAINKDKVVKDELKYFTDNFLDYSKQTNPNIQLFFVYSNGTNLTFKSYFNEPTDIIQNNFSIADIFGPGQQSISEINLRIGGKDFTHDVPVKIQAFGDEYSEVVAGSPGLVQLEIGGIFHTFKINQNGPDLKVIVKSEEGSNAQVYESGSNPYNIRF